MFFLCIQQFPWELAWHSWCNKEGGKRDSKMTILSLLNLFFQFWSAIWSVSLKAYNPSTSALSPLFVSPVSYILHFCIRSSPRIWRSSESFVLGAPMSGLLDYVMEQLVFLWSCLVLRFQMISISLIFYRSFSLSLINANLLGSISEVKSELACGFLELFNRS